MCCVCLAIDRPQSGDQPRFGFFQFRSVDHGESVQDPFAFSGELNQDLAGIVGTGLARHQPQSLQPVHQSHGAVMPQHEAFRQMANGRRRTSLQSLQHQQGLVLLGFHAGIARRGLAEVQEAPDLKSKLFELLILRWI